MVMGSEEKQLKRNLSFYVSEPEADGGNSTVRGFFSTPHTKAWFRLGEALEVAHDSSKTYATYFTKFKRIIAKEPDLLEAYNYMGSGFLDLSDEQEPGAAIVSINMALEYYKTAFKRAKELIPSDFKGKIEWSHLDNRPFLRIHHGLILCCLRKKEYVEAARLMEEHLLWNPNDNIGVRYLLGDAYLLAGKYSKARKFFIEGIKEDLVPYPNNDYSLGLLEFINGKYSAAATALRRGFVGNMYIAEMLTGRIVEKPHFFWHGSSDASVRNAKSYLLDQSMLDLWESIPQAIDFVDWLYNCAAVLRERLELAEIREGLTYEHDFAKRVPFVERGEVLRRSISKTAMLIQKVTDHRGEIRWPWEHGRLDLYIEQG